jgi:hypothetical protein
MFSNPAFFVNDQMRLQEHHRPKHHDHIEMVVTAGRLCRVCLQIIWTYVLKISKFGCPNQKGLGRSNKFRRIE